MINEGKHLFSEEFFIDFFQFICIINIDNKKNRKKIFQKANKHKSLENKEECGI